MAYFDNSTTSWPKYNEVVQIMNKYLTENGASPSRSSYKKALKVEEIVYDTRNLIAKCVLQVRSREECKERF